MPDDAHHNDADDRLLSEIAAARTPDGSPPRRLLIYGATVVTGDGERAADILIEDGRIAEVRDRPAGDVPWSPPADRVPSECAVVVAKGRHVLPAAYDMHVHFRDPLPSNPAEDLRSGSLAAAAGGVVGFAEMPNTDPMVTTPEVWQAKMDLAATKSVVDYAFFPAVSADAAERARLRDFDRTRIPALKLFMGGTTRADALSDEAVKDGFAAAAALGIPAMAHCEDDPRIAARMQELASILDTDPTAHPQVRDAEACRLSTVRGIEIARRTGAHFHVAHLTTAVEAALIAEVQAAGEVRVTTEVTLHHLFFDDRDYATLGHRLKCNPAVKSAADREGLWQALKAGVISFIATDHAPHPLASKSNPYREAPSGVPGVEMVLPAMLDAVHRGDHGITLADVARWTAENPAAHYQLRNKGRIAAGYDADLVVCDLTRQRKVEAASVRTGAGYLPWEGRTITGWPVLTLLRGRPVFASAAEPESTPLGQPLRFR